MASLLEIIIKSIKQGTGFGDAQKDAANLEKTIGGLNKILGMAGLAIGAKELIDFGKASIDAALESATADAALQTALISTGQATAEYRAQLDALATSLENTTMFTDEQVAHAEAALVTFRNLGQDVMPRTIQTVADMGQKMGDLGSAAQLAGIALNAPEQAAARLQRQGIMLSQQQKDQIATFMEMGNIAGAQGVILDALTTKYGGQAQAARDAAGGMQDWAVATGRLQEEFGKLLLAMGTESGVGGASVGLVNTLTEGSTVWADNVVQIGLFIDALNRANETLANTGEVTGGATQELSEFQKSQKGLEIIFLTVANAAIESTIGFEALAEAYGEVQAEADAAAQATTGAAAAISTTPAKVNPAQRAVKAYADSIRDLTAAQQENLNAPQTNREADAYRQLAMARTGQVESLADFQSQVDQERINKQRQAEEESQRQSEQTAKQFEQSFTQAADNIGNVISGKLQTTFQEVFKLPEGTSDQADEPARRLATVAASGFGSEWLTQLNAQFAGQDFWAPMTAAMQSGSGAELQAAATGILQQFSQGLITNLFDVNIIRAQVRAEMVQKNLREQLIEEVRQGLGTGGIAQAVGVVEVAAGNVGVATAQTEKSVSTMAVTATTAGEQIKVAFDGPVASVDILILRIAELIKMLERVVIVAQNAANGIAGLNPPAANGSLVPTESQRRMGGLGPL